MQSIPTLSSRSRLLLAGIVFLAVVITIFAWFEVSQSREELLRFVATEAGMLIETVNRSTATTLEATAELERSIAQRLRLAARLVDSRTKAGHAPELSTLAAEIEVDRIMLFDAAGNVIASGSSSPDAPQANAPQANAPQANALPFRIDDSEIYRELLLPVLEGRYSWLAQGSMPVPPTGTRMFVLVQEREQTGGAMLLGISSAAMLEMRLRLGIGKLLRDIGAASAISYVVLQDEVGILTASDGVREMSSIDADAFLRSALAGDSARSRIRDYADAPVFEIVKRLHIDEGEMALMRIGLSLESFRGIQQRSMRRVLLIAFGFFVTAAVLLVLLNTRRRFGALQQEHRKFQSYTDLVLDNIADAVLATDAAGMVTVLNQSAADLLGIEAERAPGSSCDTLCPSDAFLLRRTREQRQAIPYEETTFVQDNGQQRILAVRTSVIGDAHGAVESIVAIARDVTERRRIEEQLQRRDRVTAMGELAGGIAHEIRNPLNAINIIAQRFQHEFTPSEGADEYRQLAGTIRSEVQRVNGIITQFLEFARPPQLSLQPCELHPLLEESLDIVRSRAVRNHVEMPLIAEPGLTVFADRDKMLQVLLNLLQNALDALGEGGMIKTVACRRDGRVAISIADNGPGMSGEVSRKIFNLYFTTKSSGTGLGLSIVHQIVVEHGGEIGVTSNEDGGSTFQILLPEYVGDKPDNTTALQS